MCMCHHGRGGCRDVLLTWERMLGHMARGLCRDMRDFENRRSNSYSRGYETRFCFEIL